MTLALHLPTPLSESVRIIDDFYRDPNAVRKLALVTPFVDFGSESNFPGQESERSFHTAQHAERFEQAIGQKIVYDPSRWIFGKFRSATANDQVHARVHLDRVDWTGVVYLSKTVDGGDLGFYAHRALGIKFAPTSFPSHGCQSFAEFDERYVAAANRQSWELIASIPIEYNRCVIFRGAHLFHAITSTFGDGVDNSRLTQNFFFNSETGSGISHA